VRRVKRLALLPAALLACAASAGQSDIVDIMEQGSWAGCVFQPGFDPYPVTLAANASSQLTVTYPGLCSGVHVPGHPGFAGDGAEFILGDDNTCIPVMSVHYSVTGSELRIEYAVNGRNEGYALLSPTSPDSAAPSCAPSEAIS